MDYDYETIEAKMKSLPDDVQEAMVSFDTAKKVEEVGKKYGLAIDQIGALGDVTSYVMLGLVPGKNFVPTLMKKGEIDEKKATEIAKDIDGEIFQKIRESLRKIEAAREAEENKKENADLAQAGGISVEKSGASEDVVSTNQPAGAAISKAATLNAIENPPAFVDRLLTGTSTSVNETVVKTAAPAPQTPPVPPKPRIDPYREPIE